MGNIQTAGPNEALIVSGGCCRPSRKQIIVGGWCWNTWLLTNTQRLSLQVMTLQPRCEKVQSIHGVPVTVTAVVHCKIMSNLEFLPLAAEQFLGKSVDNIKSVILHTVEGHMRAVIGTQTIEDISTKRQALAGLIREATSKDVSRMGIDIMSLTIKDVKDDVEYLESTGKIAKALVKRNAAVSSAEAESKAAQVISGCKKEVEESRLLGETKIAQVEHEMSIAISKRSELLEAAQADAEKAYEKLCASLNKEIKSKEMEIKELEFDMLISIKSNENILREQEYKINCELPTKAEIYKIGKQTEAFKIRRELEIQAEKHRIEVEGKARAEAERIEGSAEARGMKLVAEARKDYNEAGVLFDVLHILPGLAAEIANPLTRFEEIVLVNDGKQSAATSQISETAKLSSAVPLVVQALGGSDSQCNNMLNSLIQLQMSAGSLKQK